MNAASSHTLIVRGDPILSRKAEPVVRLQNVTVLLEDMRAVMEEHDGIGIAAPQVGESLQIFLIARHLFSQDIQKRLFSDVFINPKVLKKSFKRIIMEEGCLSVPAVFGSVDRPAAVTVEALDANGQKFRVSADGLLARVLQHEIDHLNGTLFVDKARPETLHELLPDGTIKPWQS